MVLRKLVLAGALAGALTLPAAAMAQNGGDGDLRFSTGGAGTAGWAKTAPPPEDTDNWSIRLVVPNAASYAGVRLLDIEGAPPAIAPSFDFKSSISGSASGGSPRLTMRFSDGGSADLRPLAWVKDLWTHESGLINHWDNNGGTCGYRYAATYAVVLACHLGKPVTSVIVVSDSAWLKTVPAGGYTHWIDNIRYDDEFLRRPGNESDKHKHKDKHNRDRD